MSDLIEFDKLKADIAIFVEPAMSVRVDSELLSQNALEAARKLKTLQKLVDAKRVELKAPLLEKTRQLDAYVKQLMEPLERCDKHIRAQLIEWEKRLATERDAENKRLQAEREKAEREINAREAEARAAAALFGAPPPNDDSAAVARASVEREVAIVQREIADHRVSGTSKVWKVEIIDEALVPREFCDPVMTLLRDAVKRGVREIPGCRVFEEVRLAIR